MTNFQSAKVRVLAVFASGEDRRSLGRMFSSFSWNARFIYKSGDLPDALKKFDPDVVLTDATMVDGKCWRDILGKAGERSCFPPVIVSSRLADERLWAEVLNLGGYDLLVQPFDAREVHHVVSMACRSRENEAGRTTARPAAAQSAGR